MLPVVVILEPKAGKIVVRLPKFRSNYDELLNEDVSLYLYVLRSLTSELYFKSTKNHPC